MTTPEHRPTFLQVWGWPMVFILPCLLGLIIFTYLPVAMSFGLSFSYWNLIGTPKWVGLQNYADVLGDPLFWQTLKNTLVFVVGSVTLGTVVSLSAALLLNRAIRGMALFRTLFFLPVITPMVSVALVWNWLYDPQYGWINWLIHLAGIKPIPWLFDPHWALLALIGVRVWKDMGYNMVILLAGLQGIPSHLYESASLDGAGPVRRFMHVTLPMLSPTLFFVITVSLMNTFQAFDVVYMMTQGGPENSTNILVYWMFQNAFQFYKVGPASAIAYILFIIILSLTMVQWWLRKRWVLHEED